MTVIIQDISSVFEISYTVYFLPLEMQGLLKTLTSIRRNEANSDDLVSILKNVGVALSQDVIDAALKTVGPRGEYLMFLSTFTR